MLTSLSIRNVVLIDQLDLTFGQGLCVMTGETGAGKSILLDALGLALGGRSDQRLLRAGAEQATVTAAFDIPADHPVQDMLRDRGAETDGDIILRRVLGADGRTRAFINDQPVSVGLLGDVAESLIEIQGQFDQRGLLDPARHLGYLDAFADLGANRDRTAAAHGAWRQAAVDLEAMEQELAAARAEEDFLRHAVEELDQLAPEAGEADALQNERALLMNHERITEALNAATDEVAGDRPVDEALRLAARHLERVADKTAGALDTVMAAFDRAVAETTDALAELERVGQNLDNDAGRLQVVDDRLFALRDLSRKHRVDADQLPALHLDLRARLDALESQDTELSRLAGVVETTRRGYLEIARKLSAARKKAAARLDKAVGAELPPLKLDKARFVTSIDPMDDTAWTADGIDKVAFQIATNPGADPGPLGKIASGGELSRFMLALKVVLARGATVSTLVFDEVDSGIGGATAAAAGERLARLAEDMQVLVVTHSPQVAARGHAHWRVEKASTGDAATTTASQLDTNLRQEEIARMLAGRDITDEARAAAAALMAGDADAELTKEPA
jgi:DNA repair protein RecN (Recombination protein N)